MTVVENFASSGYKRQSDRKCVFSWCRSPNHSRCGQPLSLVCQSFPKQQQQIWSFLNIFPIQGSKILYHKWTESNPKAIIGPQGIYLAFDLFSCQKYINPTRRENKMQYHTHPSLIIELIERTKFDIHPEDQSLQHSSKSCQIKESVISEGSAATYLHCSISWRAFFWPNFGLHPPQPRPSWGTELAQSVWLSLLCPCFPNLFEKS